ncbi:alanine racemase [Tessaracoccus sp. ZS01]|uniref:alanine racemase n=1 Tax=Tessaracoccus sp. ZS01 TaxID=1906324 RepID=UPI00096F6EDF|nr:alanine racemase [Tessaracoccus sp. ZS01]MCG6568013.1 alanine racemase [Tessaracoccus sp. ZS01]OMG54275.1 alanine racemase [Tessaracoccus sp. ZS01]
MASPTTFRVDLDAIHANLATVRELSGDRAILAAVKANAYGHGLVPVARSIQERGSAGWLGVALTAEAEELRAAGVTLPILKFTPTFADELPAALRAAVTLSVGTVEGIDEAAAAAKAGGLVADVHLKIDTGMRRVGAEPRDAVELARRIADSGSLHLGGVFTHLPVSDVSAGDDFTRSELALFDEVVAQIEGAVGLVEWVHAANSGAVLGHDLGRTTMVRPGIMIYGSYPDAQTPPSRALRDVGTWVSRVNFIKRVAAGESVGYGRTWTAPRDTWIATVAVGYGDGYSRLLSSRGRMLIDGRSYPVVGRVCMDQTMLDLGPEDPRVRVGDEVVLMGTSRTERLGVEEVAELMDTITYEVTCLIAARVPRQYFG